MTRLLEGISALIFLLGALAMVAGATAAWLTVVVMATIAYGPWAGAGAIGVSAYLFARFHEWVRLPWQYWYDLWRIADRRL